MFRESWVPDEVRPRGRDTQAPPSSVVRWALLNQHSGIGVLDPYAFPVLPEYLVKPFVFVTVTYRFAWNLLHLNPGIILADLAVSYRDPAVYLLLNLFLRFTDCLNELH